MITDYLEDIKKVASLALEKPKDFGYWGSGDMFKTWGFAGINNTGMDTLETSNFEFISQDLMKKFPDDFRIENYTHWVCGSVDQLCVRILKSADGDIIEENITDAFKAAMKWQNDLIEYPIADENHYYDLESEEIIDSINYYKMIDKTKDGWEEKILEKLRELDVITNDDLSDDNIRLAGYYANLMNPEFKDEWNKFANQYALRTPFVS